MLTPLELLIQKPVISLQGPAGRILGFRFLEGVWRVDSLVVQTSQAYPPSRVVLLPTAKVLRRDPAGAVRVGLSLRELYTLPAVSAQHPLPHPDRGLATGRLRWPWFWSTAGVFGAPQTSSAIEAGGWGAPPLSALPGVESIREFALSEITGWKVAAADSIFGSLDDLIVDDQTWRVRYLLARTHRWLPSKSVLIEPAHVLALDWRRARLRVSLARPSIESSPAIDPARPLDVQTEIAVRAHYGRQIGTRAAG